MLDLIIVMIVATFLLVGFVRGFLREFFGLVGIVISVIITVHNYDVLVVLLGIKHSLFSHVISTVVTYIVVIVVIIVINNLLMNAINSIRHNVPDKMFGLLIGWLKGIVFSYAFIFLIQLFYCALYISPESNLKEKDKLLPAWLVKSHTYSVFNMLDYALEGIIPEDFYDDLKAFSYSLSEAMEKDVAEVDKKKSKNLSKH